MFAPKPQFIWRSLTSMGKKSKKKLLAEARRMYPQFPPDDIQKLEVLINMSLYGFCYPMFTGKETREEMMHILGLGVRGYFDAWTL